MKRVAIIMATYNGGEFLRQQIESIRAQTHKNVTLFVRDDGSTDSTPGLLREYSRSDARVKVIDDGLGPSKLPGLNFFRGLKNINFEDYDFIAFCDQDDVWMPDKIEVAIRNLDESGCGGYSSNLLAFDDRNGRAWYIKKDFPETEQDYMFQGASAGCTYVLTSEAAKLVVDRVWRAEVGLPPQFSHDWIIYAICRSHGLGWYHDRAAKILYRQHSINSFGALPGIPGMIARLRLARSGWYRRNILLVGTMLAKTPAELSVIQRTEQCSFGNRLHLALKAGKFRRRKRDAVMLAAVLLLGFF